MSDLSNKDSRIKFGLVIQAKFRDFWDENYSSAYGGLLLADKIQYASEPDFYNSTLKTYFEIKRKLKSWEWIRTKGDGKIWINQKSVDFKWEKQRRHPAESYILVMYFRDRGWFAITIEDIVKYGKVGNPPFDAKGSGDPFYVVSCTFFARFELFMKSFLSKRRKGLDRWF